MSVVVLVGEGGGWKLKGWVDSLIVAFPRSLVLLLFTAPSLCHVCPVKFWKILIKMSLIQHYNAQLNR